MQQRPRNSSGGVGGFLQSLPRNLAMIGVGIFLVVCVLPLFLFFILPNLLGGGNRNANTTTNNPPANTAPLSDNQAGSIVLGRVVSASNVNRDNCPVAEVSTFAPNQQIYVVTTGSTIPRNTQVFARLYRNGQAVEDTDIITADRDYNNSCVFFVFEPVGQGFSVGSYEAEVIVNGNAAGSTAFEVR